jgi:hypothetical protein
MSNVASENSLTRWPWDKREWLKSEATAEQMIDGCSVTLAGFLSGLNLLSFQPRFKEILDG